MKQLQRLIAIAGTATALVMPGLPNAVQAHEHTTGHQVGKVAVLAEYCGYGSRAKEIRSKFSNLLNFEDGYKYWQHYLVKYDYVHPRCGQVKDIADQLISRNVQGLGAQQSESVEKATPEYFDGRWILEVKDISSPFDVDRQVIQVLDHKFSVRVAFNGWRGTVSGQIDRAGRLDGTGSLKATGRKPTQLKFSAKVSNDTFHVNTTGSEYWGRERSFIIDLKRESNGTPTESAMIDTPEKDRHPYDGRWIGKAIIMDTWCVSGSRRFDLTLLVRNGQISGGDPDGIYTADGKVSENGQLEQASLNKYLFMEGSLTRGILRLNHRDCGAHYALKKAESP